MVSDKELSTCCFLLPLKFGVGCICMLFFAQSLVCILALVTGDIRLQGNGYNLHTYRLPSSVGALGVVFGFVGLLGVYNGSVASVRAFNRFVLIKLASMVVTMAADYWELRKCDSWMQTPEYLEAEQTDVVSPLGLQGYYESTANPAMDGLAREHVCPWARWAYLIGFSIDFSICVYFAVKGLQLEWQMRQTTNYALDFSKDGDVRSRWELYGVKDPRRERLIQKPSASKIEEDAQKSEQARLDYGSLADVQQPYQASSHFGSDRPREPQLQAKEEWKQAYFDFVAASAPTLPDNSPPSSAVGAATAQPPVVGSAVLAPTMAELPQEAQAQEAFSLGARHSQASQRDATMPSPPPLEAQAQEAFSLGARHSQASQRDATMPSPPPLEVNDQWQLAMQLPEEIPPFLRCPGDQTRRSRRSSSRRSSRAASQAQREASLPGSPAEMMLPQDALPSQRSRRASSRQPPQVTLPQEQVTLPQEHPRS